MTTRCQEQWGMGVGPQVWCLGRGRSPGLVFGDRAVPYHWLMYYLFIIYVMYLPPTPCEQTGACENITFPQLRLRAATIHLAQLQLNSYTWNSSFEWSFITLERFLMWQWDSLWVCNCGEGYEVVSGFVSDPFSLFWMCLSSSGCSCNTLSSCNWIP